MPARRLFLTAPLLLGALAFVGPALRGGDGEEVDEDVQVLHKEGVGGSDAEAAAFLRRRSLSDEQRRRLRQWVRDLGDRKFAVREQAARELAAQGAPARPFLQQALHSG